MTVVEKIFKLALNQHPLSLALVVSGVKPSSHCLVKVPKELINQVDDEFKYFELPESKSVGFYVFPRWLSMQDRDYKFVQLMIFNDESLQKLIPTLNINQSSFTITNGTEVRLTNINFYKLARTRKNWSQLTKQDVTVICGLSFGFPEQSSLKFGREVLLEEMESDREGYEVEGEPSLTFIGYPETRKESEETILSWSNFKQQKQYLEIIKLLKKIKI